MLEQLNRNEMKVNDWEGRRCFNERVPRCVFYFCVSDSFLFCVFNYKL